MKCCVCNEYFEIPLENRKDHYEDDYLVEPYMCDECTNRIIEEQCECMEVANCNEDYLA